MPIVFITKNTLLHRGGRRALLSAVSLLLLNLPGFVTPRVDAQQPKNRTLSPSSAQSARSATSHHLPLAAFPVSSSYERLWTRQINIAHEPPVMFENTLFIMTRDGIFHAMNSRDGKDIWQLNLADYLRSRESKLSQTSQNKKADSHDIQSRVVIPGFQPAPTVVGNFVIISISDRQEGHVFAISRKDGAVVWHYKSREKPAYILFAGGEAPPSRGPILSRPGVGKDVIVFRTHNGLTALRISNGMEVWNVPIEQRVSPIVTPCSTPALSNDAVYLNADVGIAYAFRLSDGRKLWRFLTGGITRRSKGVMSTSTATVNQCNPVIANDVFITAAGDGFAYGLRRQSGALVWRNRVGQTWQLSQANHRVYAATANGFFELDAQSGKTLRSLPRAGGVFGSVVSPPYALVVSDAVTHSGWEVLNLNTWKTTLYTNEFLSDFGVATNAQVIVAGGRNAQTSWRAPRFLNAYCVKTKL